MCLCQPMPSVPESNVPRGVLALAKRAAHGNETNTPFMQPYGFRPVSRFFFEFFPRFFFSEHKIFQESVSCLCPLRPLDFACTQLQL